MHIAAKNERGLLASMKSGVVTKVGRLTLGIIVKNQIAATPQKKNIAAFCTRPETSTPNTLTTVNPATTIAARMTSEMGSSMPKARKMVLK